MGGIEAADVESGIGFRIALGLRVLQHIVEGQVLILHLAQDVIAGAVEDAVDALDLVGRKRLAQHLDDRNAARDGSLEIERHPALFRQTRQFQPVLGEQRLVGGNDVLSGLECGLDRGTRDAFVAADQLNEAINPGIGRQSDRIIHPARVPQIDTTRAVTIAGRHGHDGDGTIERLAQTRTMGLEQMHKAGSDGAQPRDTEFQRLFHDD